MTAATATVKAGQARRTHRVIAAARLHLANPWPTLILPWLITLGIFGVNVSLWYVISSANDNIDADAFQYNGGLGWIYVYMLVAAVQAMSATFRYALGLSVTRKEYLAGTGLFFLGSSAIYTVGLTALAWIERLSGGWGINGAFFTSFVSADQPIWHLLWINLTAFGVAFATGAVFAAVWMRWGPTGLVATFLALAVAIVGLIWLITTAKFWDEIGSFLTGTSPLSLSSWSWLITLLSSGLAFVLLRRAVPRG